MVLVVSIAFDNLRDKPILDSELFLQLEDVTLELFDDFSVFSALCCTLELPLAVSQFQFGHTRVAGCEDFSP